MSSPKRIFVIEGREFPDPDPEKSIEWVRQYMANYFHVLNNAETIETKRGEENLVEFKKRVGEKGLHERINKH